MELKLIKQEEMDNITLMPKIWWIVCLGATRKHFHTEEEGRSAYDNAKAFYQKHQTVSPIEEVILSEEINPTPTI